MIILWSNVERDRNCIGYFFLLHLIGVQQTHAFRRWYLNICFNLKVTKANKLISTLSMRNLFQKLTLTDKSYNGIAPKLYGVRKTLKSDSVSFRLIVSCINPRNNQIYEGFCMKFCYLSQLLLVKNPFKFVAFIKKGAIPENYILISLDVVSLFTNVPKSLINSNN